MNVLDLYVSLKAQDEGQPRKGAESPRPQDQMAASSQPEEHTPASSPRPLRCATPRRPALTESEMAYYRARMARGDYRSQAVLQQVAARLCDDLMNGRIGEDEPRRTW